MVKDIIKEIENTAAADNQRAWNVFNYFCGIVCKPLFNVYLSKNKAKTGFELKKTWRQQ